MGMDVIVFDLAQLQFRRTPAPSGAGSVLSVRTPHIGVLYEHVLDAAVSDREAVFHALDQMLASFELPANDGSWCPVALANPFSHQVAFGAVPHTEVFTDGAPLELRTFGSLARLEDGVLVIGERTLSRMHLDARSTQASLAAHCLADA